MAQMAKIGQFTKFQRIGNVVTANDMLECSHNLGVVPKAVLVFVDNPSDVSVNNIAYISVVNFTADHYVGAISRANNGTSIYSSITKDETAELNLKQAMVGQSLLKFKSLDGAVYFKNGVSFTVEVYA